MDLSDRGVALARLKRYDEARECFDRAIAIEPNNGVLHYRRGIVLAMLNRLDEALASYDRAIALKPDYSEAFNNRGNVLRRLERFDAALESFDAAISLRPDNAEAHNNRGNVLVDLGQVEKSLTNFDRAIALKPDFADAFHNRGSALRTLGLAEAAIEYHDQAIALSPAQADFYNNRGNALQDLNRTREALWNYDRAIALDPDFALAHWNKATLTLLLGDYAAGWRLYEWRWKSELKTHVRNFTQPLWLGKESLVDRTILIYGEQGFGDRIQACRYVPMVKALGATVLLEVEPALAPLLSTLKAEVTLIERGKPLPAFEFCCPIMSLPLAFATTIETIPATVPYLYASPAKQAVWQRCLGPKIRPRIGLAWVGSRWHKNDRKRSIPSGLLAPLLELPLEFHTLQPDLGSEDIDALSKYDNVYWHRDIQDFSDTAAIVSELDLVISVDTSVAHLAGALGKQVWVLLPFMPDFRWMLDRNDSPWYPTATLFRQSVMGDWLSVVARVASAASLTFKHDLKCQV